MFWSESMREESGSAIEQVARMDATPASEFPAWCCPEHRVALRERSDALVCPKGHSFDYRGGVVRFVKDDANYVASFGLQWNRYRTTQLDSYTRSSISHDRLVRCLGQDLWEGIAGRQVLECGCGAGRFTEVLLHAGANVTSVDLSSAVDANATNFPPGRSHRIAQADIMKIPFASHQFDAVVCLGVIQHTPKPEATIAALWEQVRPGGTLVIDHYSHPLGWFTSTAPLFREWLRRLPNASAMRWTERIVRAFWPMHRLVGRNAVAQKLLSRLSPVRCYLHSLPQLPMNLQYQWALLDTHDALTDAFKHRRSRTKIREALSQLGAENIWCEYGGNGVEARAFRRATVCVE